MTRQTATTLGSQDGRPTELHSHGAFTVVTALIMHKVVSLSRSLFTWLAARGETLFFGFPVLQCLYHAKRV